MFINEQKDLHLYMPLEPEFVRNHSNKPLLAVTTHQLYVYHHLLYHSITI